MLGLYPGSHLNELLRHFAGFFCLGFCSVTTAEPSGTLNRLVRESFIKIFCLKKRRRKKDGVTLCNILGARITESPSEEKLVQCVCFHSVALVITQKLQEVEKRWIVTFKTMSAEK